VDGATAAGQAVEGNTTNKPPEAATQWTKAAERKANEARETRPPTKNEETENTTADGNAERTKLSTPFAQPTPTAPEKLETDGKNAAAEAAAALEAWREPEKARAG